MCKNSQSCNTKGQCSKKCWLLGLVFLGVCCFFMVGVLCVKYCKSGSAAMPLADKAVANIKAGLDVPESFKLVRSEQPDSAFGVYWFSADEQEAMMVAAMEYSTDMLEQVPNLYGDSLGVDTKALSAVKIYSPILQKAAMVMMEGKEKGAFSGWKVKTVYSFAVGKDEHYTLTRWTFFDPKGEKILGKMELPGDVPSAVDVEESE